MKLFATLNRLICGAALSSLCAWAVPASAAPIVSFVSPAAVSQGTNFAANVTVTDATDLYAFQFDLGFDPSILKVLSVSEGPFLPAAGTTFLVTGLIDNALGSVTGLADSLVGLISGANGDGILFTVSFQALATGTSALTLANEFYLDSSLADISGTVTSAAGQITVSPSGPLPTPATLTLFVLGLLGVGSFRAKFESDKKS